MPFALACAATVTTLLIGGYVWKQKEEELKTLRERNERNEQLLNKSYYSFLDSVFESEKITVDGSTGEVALQAIVKNLSQGFPKTIVQQKGCTTRRKEAMFPGDIAKEGKIGEAHLIPNDRTCSLHWGPLLTVTYNLQNGNCITDDKLRHLIEGKLGSKDETKHGGSISTLHSECRSDQHLLGIKDDCANFFPLPINHAKFFDAIQPKSDALILVPIVDPFREWDVGTGYSLLVLGANHKVYDYLGVYKNSLPEWISEAEQSDVELACKFLRTVILGAVRLLTQESGAYKSHLDDAKNATDDVLAQLMTVQPKSPAKAGKSTPVTQVSSEVVSKNSGSRKTGVSKKSNKTESKMLEFKKKLEIIGDLKDAFLHKGEQLIVPKNHVEGACVLKIDLKQYYESEATQMPIPLIVGLKAVSNWTGLHGQQWIPSCTSPTVDGDEESGCSSDSHFDDNSSLSSGASATQSYLEGALQVELPVDFDVDSDDENLLAMFITELNAPHVISPIARKMGSE